MAFRGVRTTRLGHQRSFGSQQIMWDHRLDRTQLLGLLLKRLCLGAERKERENRTPRSRQGMRGKFHRILLNSPRQLPTRTENTTHGGCRDLCPKGWPRGCHRRTLRAAAAADPREDSLPLQKELPSVSTARNQIHPRTLAVD